MTLFDIVMKVFAGKSFYWVPRSEKAMRKEIWKHGSIVSSMVLYKDLSAIKEGQKEDVLIYEVRKPFLQMFVDEKWTVLALVRKKSNRSFAKNLLRVGYYLASCGLTSYLLWPNLVLILWELYAVVRQSLSPSGSCQDAPQCWPCCRMSGEQKMRTTSCCTCNTLVYYGSYLRYNKCEEMHFHYCPVALAVEK